MLGSNPSADSVASTDSRGCYGIPFSPSARRAPYRERQKALNPGGTGAKPPSASPPIASCRTKGTLS